MNHILAPGWVQKLEISAHLTETDHLAAVKGSAFWKKLLRELQHAIAELPAHHLQGKLSRHGNPEGQEWCRICVTRQTVVPINTQTDLFYRHGGPIIWWRPAGQEARALPFVACPGGKLGVAANCGFTPMDPAQAAQAIMKGVLQVVSPEVTQS